MARRGTAIRHLTKLPFVSRGYEVFRLIDDQGDVVRAFEHYVEMLLQREYAYTTVKRYMEVVANFLDYLAEAGAFGTAVSAERLNEVIASYLAIRVRADRIRAEPDASRDELVCWAKPIVIALDLRSVSPNENLSAAINLFLRLSETTARTEWARAACLESHSLPDNYWEVIRVVDGQETLTRPQRKALKQNST